MKQQLIEHFNKWADRQATEEKPCKTGPENMANNDEYIESFIADGCVDYNAYKKAETRLLFILKEPASLRGDIKYYGSKSDIPSQMDSHWYKKYVIEPKGNYNKRYYSKFVAICEELEVDPNATAMMNINKRGGYSSGTNNQILSEYTSYYQEEIRGQIEILNPDIIICCTLKCNIPNKIFKDITDADWKKHSFMKGRNIYLFNKTISLNGKETKILGMPHPAVRMSAQKYRELFQKVLGS